MVRSRGVPTSKACNRRGRVITERAGRTVTIHATASLASPIPCAHSMCFSRYSFRNLPAECNVISFGVFPQNLSTGRCAGVVVPQGYRPLGVLTPCLPLLGLAGCAFGFATSCSFSPCFSRNLLWGWHGLHPGRRDGSFLLFWGAVVPLY